MALYEAAPGLYAALFDSLAPPGATESHSAEEEDEESVHPITVQNKLLYPVELLIRLPQPLQKAVERLIEDLHSYACQPYRGRDPKLKFGSQPTSNKT